jgi:hypothetical protein
MLKSRFLVILLTAFLSLKLSTSIAQTTLTWKDFDSITYVEKWDESYQAIFQSPTFPKKLIKLNKREIVIEGYIFALDTLSNSFYLKSNEKPVSFGCGYSSNYNNTDEIIELNFKRIDLKYLSQYTNQKVTIKGRLKLNDNAILQMPLIIESTEIVK